MTVHNEGTTHQVKYGWVVWSSAAQLPDVNPMITALIHAMTVEKTMDHTMTRYNDQQEHERHRTCK